MGSPARQRKRCVYCTSMNSMLLFGPGCAQGGPCNDGSFLLHVEPSSHAFDLWLGGGLLRRTNRFDALHCQRLRCLPGFLRSWALRRVIGAPRRLAAAHAAAGAQHATPATARGAWCAWRALAAHIGRRIITFEEDWLPLPLWGLCWTRLNRLHQRLAGHLQHRPLLLG